MRARRLLPTGATRRMLLARRTAAGALALMALVLALWPGVEHRTRRVLVAAHDITPGSTLASGDFEAREIPAEAVPDGALSTADSARGRVLGSAARRGEPLTDTRLVGTPLVRMATSGQDRAIVPVRLADSGVAELLHPGHTVDLISDSTLSAEGPDAAPLARGASVLAVRPAEKAKEQGDEQGRLVLFALRPGDADRVAAASLDQRVTATLR